jgi:hypothetical protein
MNAKYNTRKLQIRASAADGGRPRLVYALDVNKPKMTINQLPGHRWSNRAFPQNQADLDPHRHMGMVTFSQLTNNPL